MAVGLASMVVLARHFNRDDIGMGNAALDGMTRHYCTIFDSNYLAKGLAMILSLIKHSSVKPNIHVLAMDDECRSALQLQGIIGLSVYSMPEFEEMTSIGELRKTRTHQEFCWSCGAIFTDFVIGFNELSELTYIDADCFLFSDPETVFSEIGEKSIGITPHRFAKKDEARLLPNGKYAVQWVTFKGEVGRRCLSRWAGQVREWCYYRHEDGKFADQKYLDSWMTDYPGEVCEIQNPGVGLAPWNVANYDVSGFELHGQYRQIVDGHPLVMYHFHEYSHGKRLTGWKLRESDKELIYAPYAKAIEAAMALIASSQSSLSVVGLEG